MKCSHKFTSFFDSEKLNKELILVQKNWTKHFNTGFYRGEWSGIPLRSPKAKKHPLSAGDASTTKFTDEPILEQIPYTREVINSIQTEKLVIRYLRLTPGSEIKAHKDHDMIFWNGFVRLHIPIITNSQVEFQVNEELLPMKAGELWFADFSQTHRVVNKGNTDRIHLVIDCRVNDWPTQLFEQEGILKQGEQKPDPVDLYPLEAKKQMVEALLELNTETSLKMARQITERYGLQIDLGYPTPSKSAE